ncbi:DNA repair protein rad8 [Coprinopsis cinerea okayama7|uniref:DNA repair protein rad8 n=1 Tax=Coprinopsis cinerea (strain Okayama-7 / 130 / ATCC MYA-4618 / FGSC 9003) TaxID=240176 RepID=A8N8Z7_COPC7|nr:DNA repair protein rad8 [Coprinopsis cinerea okayama7\|eukprot:XP_001831325.2 DNA repair protein rad8 [Coprinopsis cinerea okayama7\
MDDDEVEEEEKPVKGKKAAKKPARPTKAAKPPAADPADLPPINEIPAIFDDLVSKIPEIKDVTERVQGRKLRVATMCSGTESPLLALELIQKSIEDQHGIKLEVEHVFSCEIEPFKQAYIERNFQPPILFRDVCELGDDEAHTAYGALVPVPGDVDMLVAGTSCVDYSNLNNQKQDIDAGGESGRTFRGMMSWVKNHRPPIVILENVCSAPWDKVQTYFEREGYSACWTRVDTKNYYIPHTRTRVYLVAVNKVNSKLPEEWKELVTGRLKRPASSTLDAFLLPSDDPRIHHARQKLVQESYGAPDRRTGRTDWSRCESRHQRARLEEELGNKRPLTSWDDGGSCKLPDFAWNDWGVAQVERVWDLMDISLLRSAAKGIDPSYKTVVWNLSQNVDRTIGSNKVGICPCLTPSMIPYITNRGGPMVGLEALSMQGLPIDKLLLTRENEDQLADLAGNAMSSTVVGACILAALVVGKKLLKTGDDKETYEMKQHLEGVQDEAMDVDEVPAAVEPRAEVLGEEKLARKTLDLSPTQEHTLAELLAHASRSSRLCVCEGRMDMTQRKLFRCKDCSTTFCKKCGGRPEHNTEPCDDIRTHPSEFAKDIKSALPMSVALSGITEGVLDQLREREGSEVKDSLWNTWRQAVLNTKDHDIHFVELKRQEIWSAIFQSRSATLELILHPQRPEWRLFALPNVDEPAKAEIRRILEDPVARLVCKGSLLSGVWEFAVPAPANFMITIEGVGELVPSWEARLGLMGAAHKDKKVFSSIKMSVPKEHVESLDRDISGEYVLLDRCGTANGALHKKVPTAADEGLPPLFMLFDPHRTNDSEDCFVFSSIIRRLEYRETRPMVCKLDPSWRQSDTEGEQKVRVYLPWKWVKQPAVGLKAAATRDATYGVPEGSLTLALTNDACQHAYALLSCAVPLGQDADEQWPRGHWAEVDKVHERGVFKSLAWLLERIRHIGGNFRDWQHLELPIDFECACERCAPTAPVLQWVKNGQKIVPIEDPVQAGEYERRLKRRPSPFVTQLQLDSEGIAHVRIGINIPSLLHRALSRLPTKNRNSKPTLSWRLDTNYAPAANMTRRKFRLLSNRDDKPHSQPPNFRIPLRPEQQRSLAWMLRQEAEDAPPFIEEEISEAILDPLGWRAEGRAERPVRVLGGALADQVGYGKTAITLGLIDCTADKIKKTFPKRKKVHGRILSSATLIIVPAQLPAQWAGEVNKFIKRKNMKVLVIKDVNDLKKETIESIQEADIIIWAYSVQRSSIYLGNLSQFAGVDEFPSSDGRVFVAHLEKTMEALADQVERLQDEGAQAVLTEIKAAPERIAAEQAAAAEAAALAAAKRLRGRQYKEAAEKEEAKKKGRGKEGSTGATGTQTKRSIKKANPTDNVKQEPVDGPSTGTASRNPSGLIPEVVIEVRQNKSSPSVSPEPADSDGDSGGNRKRPRRATAKPVILLSDDDSEEEEKRPTKRQKTARGGKAPTGKGKARAKKKAKSDDEESDYQASDSPEESDEEMSSYDDSDESDTDKKRKGKKPVKKTTKGKKTATAASGSETDADMDEDGDGMDVDEAPSKAPAKKGKKKAAVKEKRPKKMTDPWKLGSAVVKGDWTQMQCPPLEMFHFARLVIDEYTYLESGDRKVYHMVTNITADRTWILSGTPPVHSFPAVKTMAVLFGLHLGVDDDGEGESTEMKKRRREQTNVERFHSFREVHSLEWHANRHKVGQRFLDQFVRQNIAEIDEIPSSTHIEEVILPASERAIYYELLHHLQALDMTIKRGRKNESDREKRLNKVLGESKSAEEALLKRCSHFELETKNENAMKACDALVKERKEQLEDCKASLLKAIKEGAAREKALGNVGTESMFNEWVRVCQTEGVDDADATDVIHKLLDEANVATPKPVRGKSDVQLTEKVKEKVWEHREKTHEIRRVAKELTGRIRSLRFITAVRDIQSQKSKRPPVDCPGCGKLTTLADSAVLSQCGHEGCYACVKEWADKEECVYAAIGKCKCAARVNNIVKATELGEDDEERDGGGKHFGRKLEKIVDLIKNRIPKDDRVLLFVQFPDLIQKVGECLKYHGIGYLQIKGGVRDKTNSLENFKLGSEQRVLLLNVMDESASGANLTDANHVIFLSPLLTPSNEVYEANETQAVGRVVRFGQTKHVHIWKFITKNTIDEEIYNQRQQAVAKAKAAEELDD